MNAGGGFYQPLLNWIDKKKTPQASFFDGIKSTTTKLAQVRQLAGTYLDWMVPAVAAVLALVLPAALQIQEMEPADGTVPEVNAPPEATEPSIGVRVKVAPLSIAV